METEKSDKALAERLVTLMHQKGYRGDFTMDRVAGMPGKMTASLKECLDKFLGADYGSKKYPPGLELETTGADDHIKCRFQIEFGEVSGFKIRGMDIENTQTNELQHRRLDNNQQVPGSVAVGTLFHKPKPWENLLRGKFRL